MEKQELNKVLNAIFYPFIFVIILCIVHLLQYAFDVNWFHYGIYPLQPENLTGIVLSVFIHGDFNHLFNNSVSLLILGSALFYFYKPVAVRVVVMTILMGGFWTWIAARPAYHAGASGLLYGMFSFLLISGFIRRNTSLIALSFFVVLVYGGMVWGVFPIKLNVSFEAHFWGMIAGVVLAIFYRKQGPQKVEYEWPEENDANDDDEYWKIDQNIPVKVNYIYKEKGNNEERV